MTDSYNPLPDTPDDEIDLLDLLVTIADNIKLLILGPLVAVLATLASGFVLLVFVFVRQAVRNAAGNPESAPKLARIKQALGLGQRQSS